MSTTKSKCPDANPAAVYLVLHELFDLTATGLEDKPTESELWRELFESYPADVVIDALKLTKSLEGGRYTDVGSVGNRVRAAMAVRPRENPYVTRTQAYRRQLEAEGAKAKADWVEAERWWAGLSEPEKSHWRTAAEIVCPPEVAAMLREGKARYRLLIACVWMAFKRHREAA